MVTLACKVLFNWGHRLYSRCTAIPYPGIHISGFTQVRFYWVLYDQTQSLDKTLKWSYRDRWVCCESDSQRFVTYMVLALEGHKRRYGVFIFRQQQLFFESHLQDAPPDVQSTRPVRGFIPHNVAKLHIGGDGDEVLHCKAGCNQLQVEAVVFC